jgi:hypothetical protein
VRQAYITFAYRYPEWVAELFDAHFIHTHLMPLLLKAAEGGEKITPAQAAELWARQVSMLPSLRQQHTMRMIPAATHFLCMVADELAINQVGPEKNVLVETAVG